MEWLAQLMERPTALESLVSYLKTSETRAIETALDDTAKVEYYKGKRDTYRDIQAYIQNNKHQYKKD